MNLISSPGRPLQGTASLPGDKSLSHRAALFAALAEGESSFVVPEVSDHLEASAWLVGEFLGAEVKIRGQSVTVRGAGMRPQRLRHGRAPAAAAS